MKNKNKKIKGKGHTPSTLPVVLAKLVDQSRSKKEDLRRPELVKEQLSSLLQTIPRPSNLHSQV